MVCVNLVIAQIVCLPDNVINCHSVIILGFACQPVTFSHSYTTAVIHGKQMKNQRAYAEHQLFVVAVFTDAWKTQPDYNRINDI
jgi:hypothetical protein